MSYPVLSNVLFSVNGVIESREKEAEVRRLAIEEKERQRIDTMANAEEQRRKREEAALAEQQRNAMNDALEISSADVNDTSQVLNGASEIQEKGKEEAN
jgi:hypothetical protein